MKLRFAGVLMLVTAMLAGCAPAMKTTGTSPALTQTPTSSVAAGHLASLQKTTSFSADFTALTTFRTGGTETTFPAVFFVHNVPIVWSGTSFSGRLTEQGAGEDITDTVQGSVSSDGNTLVSLSYSRQIIRPAKATGTAYSVAWQGLPLNYNGTMATFQGSGADLQRYFTGTQYTDGPLSRGQIVPDFDYAGTVWTAPGAQAPTLKLSFGN